MGSGGRIVVEDVPPQRGGLSDPVFIMSTMPTELVKRPMMSQWTCVAAYSIVCQLAKGESAPSKA